MRKQVMKIWLNDQEHPVVLHHVENVYVKNKALLICEIFVPGDEPLIPDTKVYPLDLISWIDGWGWERDLPSELKLQKYVDVDTKALCDCNHRPCEHHQSGTGD